MDPLGVGRTAARSFNAMVQGVPLALLARPAPVDRGAQAAPCAGCPLCRHSERYEMMGLVSSAGVYVMPWEY
jgi:hypothetical protein